VSDHVLPKASKLPYWKSGKSAPDVWIQRTRDVISKIGGANISEAFGSSKGRAAFMLRFEIGGESFRVVWPVLPHGPHDEKAARTQAATLLYHDCKAKAVAASVLGPRTAFFHALELPDGRTVGELATPNISQSIPDEIRLLSHKSED
jgi:hypothetical protein